MAWAVWEFGAYFGGGEIPTATGTRHRRSAPYQAYRTRDGYVTVGASSQKLWANFCEQVVGQPQWLQDPRFATQALRVRHADDLERDIEAVFAHQDTAHWVTLLDAASVPGGPVFGFETTLNDPHVKFRKMVHEIEHPRIGPMKTIGLPIKSSGALGEIRLPAPWLGQHSEEILQSLGYAEADIRALFDQGVVVDRYRPKN